MIESTTPVVSPVNGAVVYADAREITSLAPLMALTLLFGILPGPLLAIFNTASQAIVSALR